MRNRLALVTVGLAALAAVGLALAGARESRSITAVSGTFAATTAGKSETRSCTTADGKTLVSSHATFTGTASGSPDLTGAVTVDARSLIDSTDGVGTVDARLRVATSAGRTELAFHGVYDHGALAGLATGHAATHGVRVVANLSSGYSPTGGFTDGRIGGGSGGGSAVELAPGRCAPVKTPAPKPAPKPKPKPARAQSQAEGTVTALSSGSITVSGLTCAVPGELAGRVARLAVGDRARIRCAIADGAATLVKVDGKR